VAPTFQFCPQCGQWVDPLADGEFEQFDLGQTPPDDYTEDAEYEVASIPYTSVTCPSCGAGNPESNRHCEECGARLSQGPLPVAPQPLLQVSAGVRAAIMITGVLLGVLLIAWAFGALTGDSTDDTVATDTSVASTTPATVPATQKLPVLLISCSSEFDSLPCSNLKDESVETYWNDKSLEGEGAEFVITFGSPVQLETIVIMNVTDEEKFRRNFRVKDLEIVADDVTSPFNFTLDDKLQPQSVRIQTLATTELTIRVTGTYAAEAYTDPDTGSVGIPFSELALAELEFYGKPGS
jgi:hypothetical protein